MASRHKAVERQLYLLGYFRSDKGSFANEFKYGRGTYQCKINDQLYSWKGSFYCGLTPPWK